MNTTFSNNIGYSQYRRANNSSNWLFAYSFQPRNNIFDSGNKTNRFQQSYVFSMKVNLVALRLGSALASADVPLSRQDGIWILTGK